MVCLTELPNCLCPGALHLHCVLLGSGMYTWLKHCGLRTLNFETNAVSLVMESHGDMDTWTPPKVKKNLYPRSPNSVFSCTESSLSANLILLLTASPRAPAAPSAQPDSPKEVASKFQQLQGHRYLSEMSREHRFPNLPFSSTYCTSVLSS